MWWRIAKSGWVQGYLMLACLGLLYLLPCVWAIWRSIDYNEAIEPLELFHTGLAGTLFLLSLLLATLNYMRLRGILLHGKQLPARVIRAETALGPIARLWVAYVYTTFEFRKSIYLWPYELKGLSEHSCFAFLVNTEKPWQAMRMNDELKRLWQSVLIDRAKDEAHKLDEQDTNRK